MDPGIRAVALTTALLAEVPVLEEQLHHLLLWSQLRVAVVGEPAASKADALHAAGIDVVATQPGAAAEEAPAPGPPHAVAAAAAAWACSVGLQPERHLALCCTEQERVQAEAAAAGGPGPGQGSGGPAVAAVLSLPASQADEWMRLRLTLAQHSLRLAEAEARASSSETAAGHGALAPEPPLLVVGYLMKASRERDLASAGLLPLAPLDGVCFAPLEFSRPLEQQLPFHAVLHKASDELEHAPGQGCVPRFGPRVQALAGFLAAHRGRVAAVDPLEATAKVINRTELCRVCEGLAALPVGERSSLRAPRSITLEAFDEEAVSSAAQQLGPGPYIVKPVVACGTADSHQMALVLWPQALQGLSLPLPAVAQEYVNHDARIYKVYVAGSKVFHTVRPSIPNLPLDRESAQRVAPSGILTFDSLASLPTALPGSGESSAPAPAPAEGEPDPRVISAAAEHLRASLGLSLFGFDVVAEAGAPGSYVVIDVNYFPHYRGAKGAPEFFRQAVRETALAQLRLQGGDLQ